MLKKIGLELVIFFVFILVLTVSVGIVEFNGININNKTLSAIVIVLWLIVNIIVNYISSKIS